MGKECNFQTKEGEIKTFLPYQIYGFRFIDGKFFISREIDGKGKVFLEYLINGKLNIYYLRDVAGDQCYIEKENEPLIELPYTEEYVIKEGKEYKTTSVKHYGILNYYTKDAPELENKIKTIKQPSHKNLISFAENYHNIVCDNEKCIIYEKKLPQVKVNFEIVGGITTYNTIFQAYMYLQGSDINLQEFNMKETKVIPEAGLLINIWQPYTNEKMFFKTGILLSEIEITNNYYEIKGKNIKIPLRFEYFYNKKRICPCVNFGLDIVCPYKYHTQVYRNKNIYSSLLEFGYLSPFTYSFSAGVNIKLLKTLQFLVIYDAGLGVNEYFLPNKFAYHSFLTGFYFAF